MYIKQLILNLTEKDVKENEQKLKDLELEYLVMDYKENLFQRNKLIRRKRFPAIFTWEAAGKAVTVIELTTMASEAIQQVNTFINKLKQEDNKINLKKLVITINEAFEPRLKNPETTLERIERKIDLLLGFELEELKQDEQEQTFANDGLNPNQKNLM